MLLGWEKSWGQRRAGAAALGPENGRAQRIWGEHYSRVSVIVGCVLEQGGCYKLGMSIIVG